MKQSKKIISLALCLALTLSMFVCLGTVTTFAASEAAGHRELNGTSFGLYWYSDTLTTIPYSSGSGTQADPYIVETAAQLRVLVQGGAYTAGKYYKLGNDIVLNDTSYEDWYEGSGLTNWIKGSDAANGVFSDNRNSRELSADLFRGNFDGDGHTISGLYINYAGTGHMDGATETTKRKAVGWALFPSVQGATFKNLKLTDVYIKSNVSKSCGNQSHGYGALIGYCYYDGATVNNVQIENVKFDLQSPNQGNTNYRVGVGSIIGYAGGVITATDCIIKNISGKAVNKYFTSSGKPGSAGSIIGFVDGDTSSGPKKHTLTNIISIGRMNPLSAGVADPAFVTTNTDTAIPLSMPIRSGSTATNVYAIGDVDILTNCGINKAVDEATFINNNLDTFYTNIGSSTNWAEKETGKLPTLKSFPYVEDHKEKTAVLRCDFNVYDATSVRNVDIYHNPWSIDSTGGNKCLKGDFKTAGLIRSSYGFILPNNAAWYEYMIDGPMEPGKIYKLEFKAKADNKAGIYYALYNGSTGTENSVGNHVTDDVYDDFGKRRAVVTTEWQTFTTYLTFESYTNTVDAQQGTERPYFFVYPQQGVRNNVLYFDDFVITQVDGVSFAAEENKYYQPTVGEIGDDITLIGDPEKQDYIFDGWYTDSELTTAFDADTMKIGDVDILYEKSVEAQKDAYFDDFPVEETGDGIYTENLYTKVTSLNAYAVNLDLANSGSENAVLGFATASEDDFDVANSVIWQKDITGKSGKVSVLLKPNTLKENGVKGDTLYLFVKYEDGADISITNFEMIDGPTSRSVEFDVNADNALNLVDLVHLKKVEASQTDINWLYDVDGDGFAATAFDLVTIRKAILGVSDVVTEKMGRTLVWNEEFDGTSLNSNTFAIKYSMDDVSLIGSQDSENLSVANGKLNMNVTRVNGTDYKVPYGVMTRNKMSFNKGYIEMSAKVNLSAGQWASYWLSAWLDDNTDEHKGEIDIFETTGSAFKPNVHSWSSDGQRLAQLGDTVTRFAIDENFDTTAYHIYGLEWDDNYLRFYVDGYNYYTVTTASLGEEYEGILEQDYYLLLGNIVYTATITADDALPRMSIDYVRLYQKDGETITVAQ